MVLLSRDFRMTHHRSSQLHFTCWLVYLSHGHLALAPAAALPEVAGRLRMEQRGPVACRWEGSESEAPRVAPGALLPAFRSTDPRSSQEASGLTAAAGAH